MFVRNARGLWGFNLYRTGVCSRAVVFGRRLKLYLVGMFVCAGDWELEVLGKIGAIIQLDGVFHALRSGRMISNAVVRLVKSVVPAKWPIRPELIPVSEA